VVRCACELPGQHSVQDALGASPYLGEKNEKLHKRCGFSLHDFVIRNGWGNAQARSVRWIPVHQH
jgi:hypothetical protein